MNISVKNMLFLTQKGPFMALITFLRSTRAFLSQKMSIYCKIFSLVKKLFRKVGFGKNMPFLRPMRAFWQKNKHFKQTQPT
jgi:hypothetical protein